MYPVRVSLQRCPLLAGRCVPQLDHLVQSTRRQVFAVWTEGHAEHSVCVARKGSSFSARVCIPKLNRCVSASRCEHVSIPAERYVKDTVLVSTEGASFLGIRHVPQLDRVIL